MRLSPDLEAACLRLAGHQAAQDASEAVPPAKETPKAVRKRHKRKFVAPLFTTPATWELPILTVSEMNQSRAGNWRARTKRKKEQQAIVWTLLVGNQVFKRFAASLHADNRIVVTLTRIAPGTMNAHDNLRASMKGVVDQIAALLLTNDENEQIEWCYAQEKRGSEYGIKIELRADETAS
jgi:hypothetical protein